MILFEDEASFRQEPTLYQTWSKSGHQPKVPTMAVKNTLKVYVTVDLYTGRFLYHFETIFNSETYLQYLERVLRSYHPRKIYLIHDNAKYHKTFELQKWLKDEGKYIESFHLPAYSPELNAMEKLWHHTRMHSTHNRFFPT